MRAAWAGIGLVLGMSREDFPGVAKYSAFGNWIPAANTCSITRLPRFSRGEQPRGAAEGPWRAEVKERGAQDHGPHRAGVGGFVRTQALMARLELSSRSRSARSAWSVSRAPRHAEAQNGPSCFASAECCRAGGAGTMGGGEAYREGRGRQTASGFQAGRSGCWATV